MFSKPTYGEFTLTKRVPCSKRCPPSNQSCQPKRICFSPSVEGSGASEASEFAEASEVTQPGSVVPLMEPVAQLVPVVGASGASEACDVASLAPSIALKKPVLPELPDDRECDDVYNWTEYSVVLRFHTAKKRIEVLKNMKLGTGRLFVTTRNPLTCDMVVPDVVNAAWIKIKAEGIAKIPLSDDNVFTDDLTLKRSVRRLEDIQDREMLNMTIDEDIDLQFLLPCGEYDATTDDGDLKAAIGLNRAYTDWKIEMNAKKRFNLLVRVAKKALQGACADIHDRVIGSYEFKHCVAEHLIHNRFAGHMVSRIGKPGMFAPFSVDLFAVFLIPHTEVILEDLCDPVWCRHKARKEDLTMIW